MRYRSAIPAPQRRFRKIPGWRQRKCTGDTTAIITTTIIVGTAGITTIIVIIAIIITVTGTAGERGSPARTNRPASLRACFVFRAATNSARLLPAI